MKNGRRIQHLAPVLMVAVIGVATSISIWYVTLTSENRAFIDEFNGRARNQAVILQNGIDDYWDQLYAARAFIEASNQKLTREQFVTFFNSLPKSHAGVLNFAWFPRVKRAERAAHEIAAAREGLPNYHIRTVAPDGSLPVSPEQDEYFPKFYSTEAVTSPVYGLDLDDGGVRERTLNRIRDENDLSVTPPLLLHTGEGDRRGIWAGLPVYARGLPHETAEDRRGNLVGIIQGVFQIDVMINAALGNTKAPVRLYLFPPNAAMDDIAIYSTSRFDTRSIEAKSQAQLNTGLQKSFPLNFGDVQWTLVVTPEAASFVSAGHERSWLVLIFGLLISGGLTSFVWVMRRNARNLEISHEKLEQQNTRFSAALNNMVQGLLMYDSTGKLIVSNRRFAELLGLPWKDWKTSSLRTTVPQAMQLAYELTGAAITNQEQVIAELQSILEHREKGKIIFEQTDGRTFAALCSPMTDGGFVVTFEDITERRRTEEKIAHMAHYDALTELPNRTLFYEKMDEFFIRASQQGGSFAILSLDLDHFKSVNDTLGHQIGDRLLQAAAERMRGCIRDTDIVARLGGDEFAILQAKFGQPADTTALATRLINAVDAPYQIDDHQVIVGASIGIAIGPSDGTNPNQIMKNADLALYRSKADGGGRYRFFEAQMDARMQQRRALELDLRKAIVNGEFTLNYQPIMNLKTGKVTTCEALIRWQQPEHGPVPPLEFVPIAEETGLIVPIGEWVLGRACADAIEWPGNITVAVNVSPVQLKNMSFIDVVKNALKNSGLPASRLQLEVTELVLMQDDNAASSLLRQLKDLGVSIAMDDFGTGYSSLGYLRSFPFDKVKIDQSFIHDLSNNKDSLAILRAVVGLGRGLNIVTTAEGVERRDQLEILISEGCTEAQGYFFSKPQSAAATRDLLVSLDGQSKAVA